MRLRVANNDEISNVAEFSQQEFFQVVSFSWTSPDTGNTYAIDDINQILDLDPDINEIISYAPLAGRGNPDAALPPPLGGDTTDDVLGVTDSNGSLSALTIIDSVNGNLLSIFPFISGPNAPGIDAGYQETDEFNEVKFSGTYTTRFVTSFVVPLPATFWLFASGLGLFGWVTRRFA